MTPTSDEDIPDTLTINGVKYVREVKADAKPELPKQWRFAEPGEPDAIKIDFWHALVVPAQPRPANYTDADGQEWEAVEWEFTKPGVTCFSATGSYVFDGEHIGRGLDTLGGYRWTARKVAKPEPDVRRWMQKFSDYSGFGIVLPMRSNSVVSLPELDRETIAREWLTDERKAAIAREEVVRELEKLQEYQTHKSIWHRISVRIAELKEQARGAE